MINHYDFQVSWVIFSVYFNFASLRCFDPKVHIILPQIYLVFLLILTIYWVKSINLKCIWLKN